MAVLRLTRFTADPDNTEELLAKRAALIAAVRDAFPGLTEARLAKLDDGTWLDVWRWDSTASMRAALESAPTIPDAAAAFALTSDTTVETAEVVDER
ncbi:MAG TPA: antibiotic biosynthesis monooxygenase [Euzebyales bacterium]|nr:antibiotic biosynthesis monooxygenase [Euzebyales bacterium]